MTRRGLLYAVPDAPAEPSAVIYLRISTKEQAQRGGEAEGFSIPAQRAACLRKVESLGAKMIGEFVDAGESARSADRPELQRLLSYVAEQAVDYVIVHKVDRLARNRYDDAIITARLQAARACLISVTENIDQTPSSRRRIQTPPAARERVGRLRRSIPARSPATARPIREIVGVDPRLNQRWSTRRIHIEARRGELAIQFQNDHGRPPTPVEALHLAQQATLETRDAKHEPRSLAEQRATWLGEAAAVLSSSEAVASMVRTALAPPAETATIVDARWVSQTASRVLAVMEESRSTWQMWHVRAEAQRQVRTTDLAAERAAALVDLLVDEVLDRRSVALAAPDNILEPEPLRRVDGSSVYTVAGVDLYTSQRILDAERRLLTAAGRRDGSAVDQVAVDLALLEMAANGTALNAGQASLVWQMCTSAARLQLAIAPAGAGKTTAMRALTLAWTQDGGQVLGLAPSAAAAAVLGEQTGIRTETLAKLTWSLYHGELPDWAARSARRRW